MIVYERADGALTPADFTAVEERAAQFHQFSQANPELGVKKLDTHRSPVIGPRLIGKGAEGPGQAVLTIVSLRGTYLSKKTRVAVDHILDYLQQGAPLPQGLRRVVTGSAVVGHDMNTAANQSIESTTWTTDHPGGRHPAARVSLSAPGDDPAPDDRPFGRGRRSS